MRWPLRNQILVPFAIIQMVTVAVVAFCSAWFSVQSAEEQVATRLKDVVATVESGTYPLTEPVLQQLRQLSGAELIVLDERGDVRRSTLQTLADPPQAERIPEVSQQSLRQLPVLEVEQVRYFAGLGRRRVAGRWQRVVVLYPEEQWNLARSRAVLLPVIWGGPVLVLTLLVSVWIARRISGRVQAVQQHVSRIATGDFQPVPYAQQRDELRDLSESVNQMATALQLSLQQAREHERAAMLTQLASGLAHHLRNALTGARVSIQLHQKQCGQNHDQALPVALTQLVRMEEHIKALLRVSRGETPLTRPGPLSDVLDDVCALMLPLCRHQKVQFHRPQPEVSGHLADQDSIRAALLNLLTNAMEATGPGGQVRLATEHQDGCVLIRVSDDGPGIPQEHQADIFAPFFTTRTEGVGIGLAVARQAAEDCGGRLELRCGDGETVFELTLPAADIMVRRAQGTSEQAGRIGTSAGADS